MYENKPTKHAGKFLPPESEKSIYNIIKTVKAGFSPLESDRDKVLAWYLDVITSAFFATYKKGLKTLKIIMYMNTV